MRKIFVSLLALSFPLSLSAQLKMTPELLWSLKRVSADGLSHTGKTVYYTSSQPDVTTEKTTRHYYALNLKTGERRAFNKEGYNIFQRDEKAWYASKDGRLYRSTDLGDSWQVLKENLKDATAMRVSPDGRWVAFAKEVLVKKMKGTDKYPDLPKTSAYIYTDLNYRHWDEWEDGKFSHLFVSSLERSDDPYDIMMGEPYDAPQKPFGGAEDFVWHPDSKGLLYVCKKKFGKAYAISTNTDLYYYDLNTGKTENWTEGMMGYDTQPVFSHDGRRLAWLSMKTEGYESDKNDLIVMDLATKYKFNLTAAWDGAVDGFAWSQDNSKIYFNAAWRATQQLFSVPVPQNLAVKMNPPVSRITDGKWDITGVVGEEATGHVVVSRTDMNHAAELFLVNPANGQMRPLTRENDATYSQLQLSNTELRMVKTKDGKQMGVWVVYPPDFDPNKKYPTLLYCQGGPQSALSQFYSFRWNFQLMAAKGYIVVAPNRRGMPGWGVAWNEAISKDWGGMPMQDYLAAIDEVAKEKYVDKSRLGCVGASYGGYSVFMLAGMHGNRFKSFIAHDGLFDLKSWYGTTEELWFANYDVGGPYWQKPQPQSYEKFDPSNFVSNWNTPIMIIQGGMDFRVPIEQGLEAFQAAQLRGIKSKLLYLPDENHWVLRPQNALVWQREFFEWLAETLK